MYVVRMAVEADSAAVEAMTRARAAWLMERGLDGQGWADFAPTYGGQAADPHLSMRVMEHEGCVIASTCLFDESPSWFWTEEERAQPAYFVASTVTDPSYAGARIGELLLNWVVDHAARTGRSWVRRGAFEPGLIHYYHHVQGWPIVRSMERSGRTVVGFARPAHLQPDLPVRTL